MNAAELKLGLRQFTGSEVWTRHWANRRITYTQGVEFLAGNASNGCYWLLDEIVFAQVQKKVKAEEFQVWILKVNEDKAAKLSCEDGNDNEVYSKNIEYTDFPLPEISLYFTDNVILLPSEY